MKRQITDNRRQMTESEDSQSVDQGTVAILKVLSSTLGPGLQAIKNIGGKKMTYYLKKSMLMFSLVILLLPVFSQQAHEKILEEVSVNWWQVPVFAVDNNGNPVTDLQPGDIKVRLNGRQITAFILDKYSFTETRREKEKLSPAVPAAKQPAMIKRKMVFLLFDRTLSGDTSTRQAIDIAQKIIMEAQEDMQFFVLTIDPYAGLTFIGEGSAGNKDQLVELIKTKVKRRQNERLVPYWDLKKEFDSSGRGKKSDEEIELYIRKEKAAKPFLRESMGFFYAFETLYLFLNSIEDNKFIYFFTEGMSTSILTSGVSLAGYRGMYYYYFKKVARYLNRCGALLFIINTMGVDQYQSSISVQFPDKDVLPELQGEDSLDLLTRESGGTYLEGTLENIVERLENMHHAYYEISFPDIPRLKGAARRVSITPKRKGIKIHSLHTLEKRKHYANMNDLEKELLVLNLITQPQNSLTQAKITAYNARVDKSKKTKKDVTYTVSIPPGYLRQSLDLYKVWLAINEQGAFQLEKIEKESLYPQKDRIKIQFQLTTDTRDKEQKKGKKELGKKTETYFVLVNSRGVEPARACVHGMELYEEDPELTAEEKKKIAKERIKGEVISTEEMNRILQGAADYCQQLKQSAFHFYCREKILETRKAIDDSVERDKPSYLEKGLVNRTPEEIYRMGYTQVNNYVFGYRLIKRGDRIIEERDWISSDDNVKVNRDQVVKTNAFFSEKAVFAPITILDITLQDRYDFQFIRFDERAGRRAVVIEALPKDPVETATIYGTLWIDRQDYSILKIEANPESIKSYKLLKDLALKLRTRLHLSLEIDFDLQQQGIRFPTKISFLEKYKGGRIISTNRAPNGWERTRTEFLYSDYQFFSVQTDVTVQKTVVNKQ